MNTWMDTYAQIQVGGMLITALAVLFGMGCAAYFKLKDIISRKKDASKDKTAESTVE
jgi:hypothetical protein